MVDLTPLDSLRGGLGNYKGVMLCTRPNENAGPIIPRPFVSRVDPKDQIGLNPTRKIPDTEHPAQPIDHHAILKRHRAWLESFKEKIRQKKELQLVQEINKREKEEKIKEKAAEQRAKTREYKDEIDKLTQVFIGQSSPTRSTELPEAAAVEKYFTESAAAAASQDRIPKVVAQKVQLTEANLKKLESENDNESKRELERLESQTRELAAQLKDAEPKSILRQKSDQKKPKWAYTEKQLEEDEDLEVEELLEFTQNLDYDKYINNLEVKNMIATLKNRIDELKKENNWKKNMVDQWNKDDSETKSRNSDNKTQITRSDARSQASETRSITSDKTHKSIQNLKDQLEKKEKNKQDWDQSSTVEKKQVSMEERIAKHIADEILRGNTSMKQVHSNSSIRKILEKEARSHMDENGGIPQPRLVANKEYFPVHSSVDPSNLPYLHRNPAV